MAKLTIRPIQESDKTFVKQALTNLWGSEQMVYSGKAFDASVLPGLLAEEEGRIVGLLTYVIASESQLNQENAKQSHSVIPAKAGIQEVNWIPDQARLAIASAKRVRGDNKICQIISINALTPGKGIGTALLKEVEKSAYEEGCAKLTVITTNDNLKALGFYQKRGFFLKAVYPNAIEKSRKIKPEIPLIGEAGIPFRDEIELEKTI